MHVSMYCMYLFICPLLMYVIWWYLNFIFQHGINCWPKCRNKNFHFKKEWNRKGRKRKILKMRLSTLTISTQEIVEQLKERKAVPGVLWLHRQSCIHVYCVEGQESFSMLCHCLRPPGESLGFKHTQRERGIMAIIVAHPQIPTLLGW